MNDNVSTPARSRRFGPLAVVAAVGLVLFAVGAVLLATGYSWQPVRTSVMSPQVTRDETVLVESAEAAGIRRGDVIAMSSGAWAGEPSGATYILRVVGMPGETVECCDPQGRILVDGAPLTEAYAGPGNDAFGKFSVPVAAGHFFVLGDRRDAARDSRAHLDAGGGAIAAAAVEGRVVAVALPLSAVRTVRTDTGPGLVIAAAVTGIGAVLLIGAGVFGAGRLIRVLRRRKPQTADTW
ncbi:signal peptidase I [Catellatospora sp. KI3]|uniref:signal peptidase I n=1 Tax=Catellatospora sp. KI3 TaxID=3041620 RepID=UPI0024831B10|nr:signal peptidase I [Catellatospora sp. KI3]MDI1460418.1 signal peptidase I [Catellatospora sp. KI3]